MKLNTYTFQEFLDLCDDEFLAFLGRPNIYAPNGRSLAAMMEDRSWGDFSEWAYARDTKSTFSNIKYQDMMSNCMLYEHQVNGLVEIKTIPRPDDTAATTAIQNYLLKATPGKRADWFVVYYADRVNEVLRPYGFYRRGFANSIETLWRSEKEGE